MEAREVGVGDDAGGERAGERLAAEVVQQQLLVGGAETEADGQARDGRAGPPLLLLQAPRAAPALHHRRRRPKQDWILDSCGLLARSTCLADGCQIVDGIGDLIFGVFGGWMDG